MYDVIIIGGGPAGLTAGLYAARSGLKSLLIEGELIGGQVSTTNFLENYPGFPEGIGGPELMMAFQEQAINAGLTIEYDGIQSLELEGDIKRVHCQGRSYEALSIILSMGASRKKLGLPNEDILVGRGISYCATCDGAFYRGKAVAVVGGGATAVEDALYLANTSKVTLIHRRDTLRVTGFMEKQVLINPSIDKVWNARVVAAEKIDEGLRLSLEDTRNGTLTQLDVAALFVAVGTKPGTDLVKGVVALNEEGYVVAAEDTLTSVPGVYAAGDLRAKPLKQIVTATADGAVAASQALQYVMAKRR